MGFQSRDLGVVALDQFQVRSDAQLGTRVLEPVGVLTAE
jgi:hypothetical protein